MDNSAPPPVTAKNPSGTKEPGFRFGCLACLVIVALGALYWATTSGLERWLRAATLGEPSADVIVIARPELHASAIVWIAIVTGALALVGLNTRSATRAILQVGAVFTLGGLALGWTCYRHFEAMRPGSGSEVDLIYLWPRPSERIDVRGAKLSRTMDTTYGGETAGPIYHLVIEMDGKRYRSVSGDSLEAAREFLKARGAVDMR